MTKTGSTNSCWNLFCSILQSINKATSGKNRNKGLIYNVFTPFSQNNPFLRSQPDKAESGKISFSVPTCSQVMWRYGDMTHRTMPGSCLCRDTECRETSAVTWEPLVGAPCSATAGLTRFTLTTAVSSPSQRVHVQFQLFIDICHPKSTNIFFNSTYNLLTMSIKAFERLKF